MRQFIFGALLAFGMAASFTSALSQPAFNEKNPRIQLVSEFVRELEVLYRLQETTKKEIDEDGSTLGRLTTSIRVGTRTIFEMNESVNRLDGIALDGQWAGIRDMLKKLDTERMSAAQEMNYMSKTMLSAPKPGIDYGAMTARAPELTATIEQIDKTVFTASQAVFFALVDERRVAPDGKLHHLLLTKRDRTAMIQLIDKVFGPQLEDKNASSIVSAALIIKYGLTRPIYKSADEP